MEFKYGKKEREYLKETDPLLGKVIDEIGHIKRTINPDPFSALVESVLSQQVSSKAAETIINRLLQKIGKITPENLLNIGEEEIRECGISLRKVQYIKKIAQWAKEKKVDFTSLDKLSDKEVIQKLTALPGVGQWTAEMLLIFSLGRKDIVSFNDLGIRKGMMKLYNLEKLTKEEFMEYKNRYSPYGTIASFYLWELNSKF
ncbi:DNA-3-methyladenine glycosylase II [Anaerobranca californiensis DSM 14826]|jgi:3-methyladenine DNA glycosylase/8-oxoguanine DNA glycosylase|uniref:DNA-3-methyladenine glycosylase II n=1 Tax=Anaerobranca californiensis DSM 14826 TaxID=1120989 RepID=A0A1M6RPM9_9FIRM|nr:DNA-3-methyladenine glycosylase [Anaerobranca californiensis]SHK34350.1 DNA-3-methyladenine glycosylase II [Anaerobranca californiensis DSM 14826]